MKNKFSSERLKIKEKHFRVFGLSASSPDSFFTIQHLRLPKHFQCEWLRWEFNPELSRRPWIKCNFKLKTLNIKASKELIQTSKAFRSNICSRWVKKFSISLLAVLIFCKHEQIFDRCQWLMSLFILINWFIAAVVLRWAWKNNFLWKRISVQYVKWNFIERENISFMMMNGSSWQYGAFKLTLGAFNWDLKVFEKH